MFYKMVQEDRLQATVILCKRKMGKYCLFLVLETEKWQAENSRGSQRLPKVPQQALQAGPWPCPCPWEESLRDSVSLTKWH